MLEMSVYGFKWGVHDNSQQSDTHGQEVTELCVDQWDQVIYLIIILYLSVA